MIHKNIMSVITFGHIKLDGPYWSANILIENHNGDFRNTRDRHDFSTLWSQVHNICPFDDKDKNRNIGFFLYNPKYDKSFWIGFPPEFQFISKNKKEHKEK